MKKKYTLRILDLAIYLLVGLLVVGCHKEKEDITDEEQIRVVMENAEVVMDDVSKIYEVSGTVEEMAQHLDEIKAMPNVEDAYQDDISICVKIKDGGIIMWSYFPEEEDYKRMDVDMLFNSLPKNNFQKKQADKSNALCEEKSLCILNVLEKDFVLNTREIYDSIRSKFEQLGWNICLKMNEEVTPDFLVNNMPNYGVTIINTHGIYSKKYDLHFLQTGMSFERAYRTLDDAHTLWGEDRIRYIWLSSPDSLGMLFLMVNEDYLDACISGRFPNNSLLFLDACNTLKGSNRLWLKLENKGLGCIIGYNDTVLNDEAEECLKTFMYDMMFCGYTASESCTDANNTIERNDLNLLCYPYNSDITIVEHLFSVGNNQLVQFSLGNLADGGRSIVGMQWEYGGYFGWGTGGNPNNHSTDARDYSGPFDDWGDHVSGGWRTMTKDEWEYLLKVRPGHANKKGTGRVNGTNGLILLPDEWLLPDGCLFSPGNHHGWIVATNDYSLEQWEKMELAGAIFLPAAGGRIGENAPIFQNQHGFYWTSTPVYRIAIYDDSIATHGPFPRFYGQSVRLVRDRND